MVSGCSNCQKKLCAGKVPMFENLDYDELVAISNKIKHKSFEKGELIFREGNISDVLYFVSTGRIKIYKYTKDGKEQILHILSEGDFFGELNLLKSTIYNFNAKAIDKTNICTLTKQEFKNIMIQNPEISIKLLESVGNRLSEAENLAQNLATNDIDSRMAYLILDLTEKYGISDEKYLSVKLPLSREEMANYIGITRETISRKLKKFEGEGLIKLVGTKKIMILDKGKLEGYI